uniref:Ig-like domain-containing protein n=1 Tax=Seriola lalandi dorsalis TaxID=1841481 RepID=A0A3B4X8K7_SERLL
FSYCVFLLTVYSWVTVTLQPSSSLIYSGEKITVRCEMQGGGDTGWTYEWRTPSSNNPPSHSEYTISRATESHSGDYSCRGRRDYYLTEWSQVMRLTVSRELDPSNTAVVTLQPNWPEIYRGETITVSCEIQGGDTEWMYEWEINSSLKPSDQHEYRISSASSSHSGDYRCRGRMKSAQHNTTEWSDSVKLTVNDNKPRPVLTVSPSWLSPGASVTLNCEVEHPSAGWRFYWYKATHTAGYVCKAGRGDPVIYTENSELKFVWSGGEFVVSLVHKTDTNLTRQIRGKHFCIKTRTLFNVHICVAGLTLFYVCSSDVRPSASLTVSPDRVQHFTSDSVSLSCEGNSTEWRVMRFAESKYLSCSAWGRMTGSSCDIDSNGPSNAVYWCESGSGEFSNTVNITVQNDDFILLSPVRPVTEGESVILGCKLRTERNISSVFFYQNDKLIQNDSRVELNISAVSQSDEGFYKCQSSGRVSAQSWMSVKGETLIITKSLISSVFNTNPTLLFTDPCCNRFVQHALSSPISFCY